jgi:hypothetical protein
MRRGDHAKARAENSGFSYIRAGLHSFEAGVGRHSLKPKLQEQMRVRTLNLEGTNVADK